jgi:hypothetical protein
VLDTEPVSDIALAIEVTDPNGDTVFNAEVTTGLMESFQPVSAYPVKPLKAFIRLWFKLWMEHTGRLIPYFKYAIYA